MKAPVRTVLLVLMALLVLVDVMLLAGERIGPIDPARELENAVGGQAGLASKLVPLDTA